MTLRIKDIMWQCCKSTSYVEIRPYGCSCSYLPPANKCEHSHSHWQESPSFHPVRSNLFYLQIFTMSCPFRTRFTVCKYSYVLPAPPQTGGTATRPPLTQPFLGLIPVLACTRLTQCLFFCPLQFSKTTVRFSLLFRIQYLITVVAVFS